VKQYISWFTRDLVRIMLAAIDGRQWRGPSTRPPRLTQQRFSKAWDGLHRPSLLPCRVALRLLYGEMAEIVTSGARVHPPGVDARLRVPQPKLEAAAGRARAYTPRASQPPART
jgi:NAD dependent epimerase/dehydratase family enzyme